ncbi:Rrf2 family transcriptional repressor of oqxAB [Crossiella equi]|uniref:Rrf2 family transcriptional repressor of oqxAB n=1 Tax=Crossiella equi TaxID=130796 RepID=A0ABS5AQA4_9PSEU|nr:Rrf2 family transcriptional regulator [Crossiella equi]MBP2478572.1 Rrf2 family transcriptional repressor of oqxAB [Crossiella equi]
MLDIRFSSALKVMLFLAVADQKGEPVISSAQLADGLGANASLVRKLLVPLVRAGLLTSTKGRTGGTRLAKPAERITLAEIYRCVIGDKPLWNCRPDGEHVCLVTGHSEAYFAELTATAEQAVLASLEGRTLADGVRDLWRLHEGQPAS